MSKIRTISAALPLVCAAALFAVGPTKADTVATFGNTLGTGPWNLTSVCVPACPPGDATNATYSGVYVTFSTPLALSTLNTLSASFVDNAGGAGGGSPRIGLYATNGDFFLIYLGPPGSFDDPNSVTFATNFSGTNLINGTNDSAVGNSGSYQTFASLLPTYGTDLIGELDFFLDGAWVRAQDLTLNGITVNDTTYTSSLAAAGETPLPAALPLFASGLGALGFVGWRKRRKRTV